MRRAFHEYLGALDRQLHIDARKRAEIVSEVGSHLEERSAELESSGLSFRTATRSALTEIGSPHRLAHTFYAVHAPGSWRDILLAVLPHLALAGIFAFHLWTELFWVVISATAATLIAVIAWRRGSPQWTYPWLGYALAAPALTWALATAAIGYGAWAFVTGGHLPLGVPLYLAIALYIPISLVIVVRVARRAVRHDWLSVSLATLPIPFFTTWIFLLHWRGGVLIPDKARALEASGDTAVLFLGLAVVTALYMKAGHRAWRMGLMLVAAPVLVTVAALSYQADPRSLPTAMLAIPATALFIFSPFMLDLSRKEAGGLRRVLRDGRRRGLPRP